MLPTVFILLFIRLENFQETTGDLSIAETLIEIMCFIPIFTTRNLNFITFMSLGILLNGMHQTAPDAATAMIFCNNERRDTAQIVHLVHQRHDMTAGKTDYSPLPRGDKDALALFPIKPSQLVTYKGICAGIPKLPEQPGKRCAIGKRCVSYD
jgi:hypothetical protein